MSILYPFRLCFDFPLEVPFFFGHLGAELYNKLKMTHI